MEYLKIVLRLNHILSGVFWVGSSIILGFFITPTVAATAEAGQKQLKVVAPTSTVADPSTGLHVDRKVLVISTT